MPSGSIELATIRSLTRRSNQLSHAAAYQTICVKIVNYVKQKYNQLVFFRHHKLKEELMDKQKRFLDSEKLDALSRKMCGEGVGGALSSLRSKWDSLDVLMESHQEVIKAQVNGYIKTSGEE